MSFRISLALVSVGVLWIGKFVPRAPRDLLGWALLAYGLVLAGWLGILSGTVWSRASLPFGAWRLRWIPVGAVLGLGLFVSSAVGYAVAQGPLGLSPPPEAELTSGAPASRLVLLLGVALASAVLEEWIFRGVLLDYLAPLPAWVAAGVGALAFAAYHLSLFQLLPTFLLGLGLVLSVQLLGSLWPAVLAHGLFNLLGLILTRMGVGGG